MKLIGFTGKMGSGKSTAIELLWNLQCRDVLNVKFAAPLYEMQDFIYGVIRDVYKIPADFKKDRKLLQWLGTEWGRETISPTIWIDLWKSRVKQVHSWEPTDLIVCDDVRFDNEAEALKELGGKLIQVTSDRCGDRINVKSGITGHASEGGVDLKYVDAIIENNGPVYELEQSLLTCNSIHNLW